MIRIAAAALAVLLSIAPALAGTRELMAALHGGNIVALRAELVAGADPNGDPGSTPMAIRLPVYLAARAGRADMLALLVEFGADIDRRDRNRDRALDWAARHGETEIVRLLLAAGASPDPREHDPGTHVPLVEAIKGGHGEVAHILLDQGADVDRNSAYDGAPLNQAAGLRDISVARRLLAMGAGLAPREKLSRQTPLHSAAARSTPEMVRMLINAGAPLDARDWDGETPLFQAARLGRHEIVSVLLEAGAAVDIPDELGRTPLVAALTNRPAPDGGDGLDDPFVPTRDLLMSLPYARPDLDYDSTNRLLAAVTHDLDTALAEAVWGGWQETARVLVSRGALGQARTRDGRAALAGVFHYPGLAMFDLLSEATTNLSIDGNETLLAAAAAGRMDIAHALFLRRYRVDTRGPMGRTALMASAIEGRVAVVAELRALGADPEARDDTDNGIIELMRARLTELICRAEDRAASRAYRPTDHIESEVVRLEAAYREILQHLATQITEPLLPEDGNRCGRR